MWCACTSALQRNCSGLSVVVAALEVLAIDPAERCTASDILQVRRTTFLVNQTCCGCWRRLGLSLQVLASLFQQADWMRVTDPAASASAALLEKGTLLYNLRLPACSELSSYILNRTFHSGKEHSRSCLPWRRRSCPWWLIMPLMRKQHFSEGTHRAERECAFRIRRPYRSRASERI